MSGIFLSFNKSELPLKSMELLSRRGSKTVLQSFESEIQYVYAVSMQQDIEKDIQIERGGVLFLIDGTIYSSPLGKVSSIAHLELAYKAYRNNVACYLDGDYTFCIYDPRERIVLFSADVFGTKPLWFSLDAEGLSLCSYRSPLKELGCRYIHRLRPNTSYCFYIDSRKLKKSTIHAFDLTQYKTTYNDWIMAFASSVEKRSQGTRVALGLSSGYDSGAIYCELVNNKFDFYCYSFIGKESRRVLNQRHLLSTQTEILAYNEHNFLMEIRKVLRECEPYHEPFFDIYNDEATFGMSIMCQNMQKNRYPVILSGIGADEIISDYGYNGKKFSELSEFGGLFPSDLKSIFPWRNFFGGTNRVYLTREEYISGMFGLQVRYPFLDVNLVQEFIWLKASLKNQKYKAPLYNYFIQNNFPFIEEKVGFFVKDTTE